MSYTATQSALAPSSNVFLRAAQRRAATQAPARRGNEFLHQIMLTSFVGDGVVVILALCGAFFLRFRTPMRTLGVFTGHVPWAAYAGHIVFEAAVFLLILHYFNLYSSRQTLRWRKVGATLAAGAAVWLLSNLALTSLLSFQTLVSRLYLVAGCICCTTALLSWRLLFDAILRTETVSSRLRRRILCVGWSEEAGKLGQHIAADGRHPYQIVGAVPAAGGNYVVDPPRDVRQLGDYGDLPEVLAKHAVDMVMVCDPDPSRGELIGLANLCEKEIVDFKIIPSCFQILLSGLHLETVSGVPVLGVSRLPLDSAFAAAFKRMVDICGSILGLILGAPLIAIFGFLVWMESPGPIFYRQRRCGLNGNPFWILKIRSMKLNSDTGYRAKWTLKNDPRRLKIGALMRSWNVDELPQFLNVLKGEMSLVGPRPESLELIVDFKDEIPHYNARHTIKPGITGWAQVNGLRGDTDLTERVRCDLYYMETWSPLLDFQIMLMTFFKHKNAG